MSEKNQGDPKIFPRPIAIKNFSGGVVKSIPPRSNRIKIYSFLFAVERK